MSELAAAAIAESLSQLRANVDGALRKQRPESLHQARVGLRKLRIYVRLFRARIGRARSAQLGEELRWTFRLLGELRDLQVFMHDVLPRIPVAERAASPLQARLEQRANAASQRLRAPTTAARLRDLCAALQALERALCEQSNDVPAQPWLAKRLDRQRKRLRKMKKRTLAGQTDLHALRKRIKKLRYTADLARMLGKRHPARERSFRRALGALQDNLGALNDARVAETLIAEAHVPAAPRVRLQKALAASAQEHLVQLPDVYGRFAAAQPFWG